MKTTRTRLISIFLATMMVLSMSSLMFAVSAVNSMGSAVTENGVIATATETDTGEITVTLSGEAIAAGTHTIGLTGTYNDGSEDITLTITPPATVTKTVEAEDEPTDKFVFTFTQPDDGDEDSPTDYDVTFTVTNTFAATGSESGDLALAINYVAETLTITGGSVNTVAYVYATKYDDSTPAKAAKAKWYPMYGNELDISLLIPKKDTPNKPYIIAVKAADGTGDLMTIVIKGRPETKDIKKAVTYNFATEKLQNADTTNSLNVYLNNSNLVLPLSAGADITISYDLFPAGSSFTFKIPAVTTSESEAFASAVVKGKIAAQAKAPNVSVVKKNATTETPEYTYLKGSKDTMEIIALAAGADEATAKANTTPLGENKAITAKDLKVSDLNGLVGKNAGDAYWVVIRTAASTDGKKGYSAVKYVQITADNNPGSGSEEPTPDTVINKTALTINDLIAPTDSNTAEVTGDLAGLGTGYTVAISWTGLTDGKYGTGTPAVATITFTAATGYTFTETDILEADVKGLFTVGTPTYSNYSQNATTITITLTYTIS